MSPSSRALQLATERERELFSTKERGALISAALSVMTATTTQEGDEGEGERGGHTTTAFIMSLGLTDGRQKRERRGRTADEDKGREERACLCMLDWVLF